MGIAIGDATHPRPWTSINEICGLGCMLFRRLCYSISAHDSGAQYSLAKKKVTLELEPTFGESDIQS